MMPRLLTERRQVSAIFILAMVPVVIFQIGTLARVNALYPWMVWVGYLLVPVGVMGRSFCTVFIGGKKSHEIIEEGPYSIVRNPLYVFSFIGLVGIGLESASPLLLALLVGGFCWYYRNVVKHEEEFLEHTFGEPFVAYMARVPRWWPKFSLWKEPTETMMQPRLIRKTMMDASLFFLALPLFALIQYWHDIGAIPTFLGNW